MAAKKAAARARKVPRRTERASQEELERFNKLVEVFERGLKALHRGEVDRARIHFESLIADSAGEKELQDRFRSYLAVCARMEKKGHSFSPRVYEELVASGVYWHNEGDYAKAIKYLSKAIELEPKSEDAQYCLAAAYARAGDPQEAARHLKQVLLSDPYSRVLAASDGDFDSLRQETEIAELLEHESNLTP